MPVPFVGYLSYACAGENGRKKIVKKKRDIMISMIIKLTCNDKNL